MQASEFHHIHLLPCSHLSGLHLRPVHHFLDPPLITAKVHQPTNLHVLCLARNPTRQEKIPNPNPPLPLALAPGLSLHVLPPLHRHIPSLDENPLAPTAQPDDHSPCTRRRGIKTQHNARFHSVSRGRCNVEISPALFVGGRLSCRGVGAASKLESSLFGKGEHRALVLGDLRGWRADGKFRVDPVAPGGGGDWAGESARGAVWRVGATDCELCGVSLR
jgi:hypothetical protein